MAKSDAKPVDPITFALRQMHKKVEDEPIPDDLMALLAQLDDKSSSTNGGE